VKLEQLTLYNNYSIVDIGPLSSLTALWTLDLTLNSIVDVSPLVSLTGLQTLDLNANDIVDVSPLAAMTWLRVLSLSDNAITTGVASLVMLVNAEGIYFHRNFGIPSEDLATLRAALPDCNIAGP